jgi:hypothetical protein
MSDKTLAQKMHIKPASRVLLLDAPPGYADVLAGLPQDAGLERSLSGNADVILCFLTTLERLREVLPPLRAALKPGGALWIAYAKGTSKLAGDANRDTIWSYAGTVGMAAVSLVAIDADWAALRLKPA